MIGSRIRKAALAGVLLAGSLGATASSAEEITPVVASPEVGDDTERYWSLEELINDIPAPGPSQPIGNALMAEHQGSPNFVGVFLDGPHQVRVVFKDGVESIDEINGVTVVSTSAKYSFDELRDYALTIRESNPTVHQVEIDADGQSLVAAVPLGADTAVLAQRNLIPTDVRISVENRAPVRLDAAQGGSTATGNGSTTGFRMNGNRISTASHCGDSWGTVNGIAMTHRSSRCVIDNQWASGSSMNTTVGSHPWTGVQGDPANGAQVYKYGNQTGWTYGYAGNYVASGISCSITALTYTGGNISSIGGDSGGPCITTVWNGSGYSYHARGTHRGTDGSNSSIMHSIPMSEINGQGWNVG